MNKARAIDSYYLAPFAELVGEFSRMDSKARRQQLAACEKALAAPSAPTISVRVGAVKILVALLPHSLAIVRRWLRKPRTKRICDVHFSLFCFLDQIQYWQRLAQARPEVLALVGAYLMRARSDTAQSAWMAGDLLGDHWVLRESLPVLIAAASTARYAAGRAGAIHGLEHALARCSGRERTRIEATLQRIASRDGSEAVRLAARAAVGETSSPCRLVSGNRR